MMERSLVMTLADKFKTSVPKIYRKYQAKIVIDGKAYKGLQITRERPEKKPLIARWGGISLAWKVGATLDDQPKQMWGGRTELEKRLLADECEYCGSTENIEVHHIRGLKDLNKHKGKEKPEWIKLMATRRRKTMVVCRTCHQDITYGKPMQRKPSKKGFMHDPKGWRESQTRT
jgi:hypothetical protein